MTEQTNAELVAELRGFAEGSESARATLMRDAAERLEAADQQVEDVLYSPNGMVSVMRGRRDAADQRAAELAAVVEKVRERNAVDMETDDDRFEFHQGIRHAASNMEDILATAPADVLRERDAALIEKLADEWHAVNTGTSPRAYNWLHLKARQRREEADRG